MNLCLHTDIAAAALQKGEAYSYRNWMLLRAAGEGRGHCRLTEFRSFLKRIGFRRPTIDEIVANLLQSGMARRGLAH